MLLVAVAFLFEQVGESRQNGHEISLLQINSQ
jgi:hypothetical protein